VAEGLTVGTYTQIYYHLVWATRQRREFISAEIEPHLLGYIRYKCDELRVPILALNSMPEHVHLAVSLPPRMSLSTFVETIKGASAHFVNHLPAVEWQLYWQPGYGALTFARKDLPRIVAYIDDQKEHHASGRLSSEMERADDGWPSPETTNSTCNNSVRSAAPILPTSSPEGGLSV
jgi:putative transposase